MCSDEKKVEPNEVVLDHKIMFDFEGCLISLKNIEFYF